MNWRELLRGYLLWSLPLVLACVVWGSVSGDTEIRSSGSPALVALWEVLSWYFLVWCVGGVVFLLLLVVDEKMRGAVLAGWTGAGFRDEREARITAEAGRYSHLSTLAVTTLALFLSILTVEVHRLPESQALHGRRGQIQVSLDLGFYKESAVKSPLPGEMLARWNGWPVSPWVVLLGLILWQTLAFRFWVWVENRRQLAHSSPC